MKTKLITHTQDLLSLLYLSANTCYSPTSPLQRLDKLVDVDDEKKQKLLNKCIKSGHESVLEHSQFTFGVEGVSRALLAQITRHRLCSFSVKSQRYVQIKEDKNYLQDVLDRGETAEILGLASKYFVTKEPLEARMSIKALISYTSLIEAGYKPEDARTVLPNCTKTDFVITCNLREFMHLCNERLCSHAQLEIRQLLQKMVQEVVQVEPWLKPYLVPKCEKLGYCPEDKSCGRKNKFGE